MLVLAALHYGALRGDRDLAPLYERLASRTPEEFASRVTAVLEARPELVREQLWRATQTNEPGRSAVLAAVLNELHGRGVGDVHLIDVGTSMGLNLYPDYYRINDDEGDDVILTMEDLNNNVATSPLPRIHERIGIDLNPLDPENPDDVLWLKACLWPEEPQRARRLDAILQEMVLWPRATRLKGSAVDLIDDALDLCSPDATPVIFHSWVAAYFTSDEQSRWRERIMRHVRTRATWIYFEHPWGVKGLDPPERTRLWQSSHHQGSNQRSTDPKSLSSRRGSTITARRCCSSARDSVWTNCAPDPSSPHRSRCSDFCVT
jgi:hypothetical protein